MYEHRRMCYKFSPASKNNCVFCGRKIETQHHVLCECQGEKVAVIKQKLYANISNIIIEAMEEQFEKHTAYNKKRQQELIKWAKYITPKLWEGQLDQVPQTLNAKIDKHIKDLDHADIMSTWRGIVPTSLVKLLGSVIGRHQQAQKTAGKISVLIQDAVVNIWQENKKLKAEPKKTSTIDYALELHQRGLLLTQNQLLSVSNPVQTYEDYKALPKKHRENIVNKRLRTMGIERGMRIPDRGDIVRSYSIYDDKSTHISALTLTKIDHLEGKCEVEDLFSTKTQTRISSIAAHIVQPDKLTFAEHDLVDRCTTADQKLSGIYALHPRAINVTPTAELVREDEEIELVDLKELVSNAVPE